jgi:hypothetical protein
MAAGTVVKQTRCCIPRSVSRGWALLPREIQFESPVAIGVGGTLAAKSYVIPWDAYLSHFLLSY